MEDISGNIILPSKQRIVVQDAKAWWQVKYNKGIHLTVLSAVDWDTRKAFHNDMEAAHPWLCYCADHWKVDQIWRDVFSKWKPAQTPTQGGPQGDSQTGTLQREHPINDDQDGPSSKRSKITTLADFLQPKPTKKINHPLWLHLYVCVCVNRTNGFSSQCICQHQTNCKCRSSAKGMYTGVVLFSGLTSSQTDQLSHPGDSENHHQVLSHPRILPSPCDF